jgi:hypothetical protein
MSLSVEVQKLSWQRVISVLLLCPLACLEDVLLPQPKPASRRSIPKNKSKLLKDMTGLDADKRTSQRFISWPSCCGHNDLAVTPDISRNRTA